MVKCGSRRPYITLKRINPEIMGQLSAGRSEDGRGRALVAGCRGGGRDQGKNQMRNVGLVLSCRSVGVLRSQPHFIRNTGWKGGCKRPQRWSPGQCQTAKLATGVVPGASGSGSPRVGV